MCGVIQQHILSLCVCLLCRAMPMEFTADRLYGFAAGKQGSNHGVSRDFIFPRKQRVNLLYLY